MINGGLNLGKIAAENDDLLLALPVIECLRGRPRVIIIVIAGA